MSSKPSILFLVHSASRNGATILLLHLLRWLKEQGNFRLNVLTIGRGEMVDEFRSLAPTRVWRSPAFFLEALPRSWRPWMRLRLEALSFRAHLAGRHFDLIYANTAATWRQVAGLAARKPRLLWHIHELGYALRATIGEAQVVQWLSLATRIVAASRAVRDNLVNNFGVSGEIVDQVHEFIPFPPDALDDLAAKRRQIRQALGWGDACFVVGASGSLGWRKGSDLFLQIAGKLSRNHLDSPFRFLWVGGEPDEPAALQFAHDMNRLRIHNVCQRIPTVSNMTDYYCAMDAFALPSREDPFPLVMLEASAVKVPVVCFHGTGGGPEFIGDDSGLVAPYSDIDAFAQHLITLHENPQMREQLGANASRKVKTLYSPEVQAPAILKSIQRCLGIG